MGDGAEEGIFVRGLPEMNIRDIYLNGDKCSDIRVRDTDASKAVRNAAFPYGAAQKTLQIN